MLQPSVPPVQPVVLVLVLFLLRLLSQSPPSPREVKWSSGQVKDRMSALVNVVILDVELVIE